MTTLEAAEAVRARPLVIIPAGAFEQHGPGMPLATDTIRAEHVAELVALELAGRAVIGPSVPVGVSPHHLAFAGTVTLTTTTLAAVVREYADSLHRHGWRKILVITGHGGNNATLTTVAQDLLTTHPDLQFAWTPLTSLAADVVAGMRVSEVHGHSGEAETAQMLHLAPHLVHTERLAPGTTHAGGPRPAPPAGAPRRPPRPRRALRPAQPQRRARRPPQRHRGKTAGPSSTRPSPASSPSPGPGWTPDPRAAPPAADAHRPQRTRSDAPCRLPHRDTGTRMRREPHDRSPS